MSTTFLLHQDELPRRWYNVLADFERPLDPPVRDVYRRWRPTPLQRAVNLKRALGTPARLYFKYEGGSPTGSHKANTAVAQAYYNKLEGTQRLMTETGAGQWGSAIAFACGTFGLGCDEGRARGPRCGPGLAGVVGDRDFGGDQTDGARLGVAGRGGGLCRRWVELRRPGPSLLLKMHTMGADFVPPPIHAGGLRYHGMAPIVSRLVAEGVVEPVAYDQVDVFESALLFARTEGIVPAPETAHAIHAAVELARRCAAKGEAKSILIGFSGHGHFDMSAYEGALTGALARTA